MKPTLLIESPGEGEQLLKRESLSKESKKKRKNVFRKKQNNSLVEQDFAKILIVSEFRRLPASFDIKISAIAPETALQINFEVEKKHKTFEIGTADDVIATSQPLARELLTSATRCCNRNSEIRSRTRGIEDQNS